MKFLLSVLLLLPGCSVFRDPPGPYVPDWSFEQDVGNGSENKHPFAARLDAGYTVIQIGACMGGPVDGSPDEAGVWHYHATAGPCPESADRIDAGPDAPPP